MKTIQVCLTPPSFTAFGVRCEATFFVPSDQYCKKTPRHQVTCLTDKRYTLMSIPVYEFTHFDALKTRY
ncbi:hypothetical protein OK016_28945 [Vibrio chagasii]|nr:hypothetical protein [Vibrio chagasii]